MRTFILITFHMQYHGNELAPLKDEYIATKVMHYLSKCIKDFEAARVTNVEIARFPKSLTHLFPGSFLRALQVNNILFRTRHCLIGLFCFINIQQSFLHQVQPFLFFH